MTQEFSLRVENRPEDLDTLNRFLEDFSRRHSLNPGIRRSVQLCLEEIFTNILRYAFQDDGRHRIDFRFRLGEETLEISIEDDGIPFNPLDNPRPDIHAALQDRQVGGLGIHLVRSMMDRVTYDRKDDKNILTIERNLNRKTSEGGKHGDT